MAEYKLTTKIILHFLSSNKVFAIKYVDDYFSRIVSISDSSYNTNKTELNV